MRKKTHFSSIPRTLTSAFMAALIAGESTHYNPDHHNPHGNRRERIEEIRVRMAETQHRLAGAQAAVAGGSSPPAPQATLNPATAGRRRMFGLDGQQV